MNGGYLMVSKSDTNLYTKLNNALTVGKPILWYEDANTCYYIDTITKSGTDIVLTKGGKTITVESDGDITEVGEVLTIMENIVDANGNKRFIEGNVETAEVSGLTITYSKWSLSGTHLMLVIAGKIDSGSSLSTINLGIARLPDYINDKIVGVVGELIYTQTVVCYGSDFSSQNLSTNFRKRSAGIDVIASTSATFTADRYFRAQYDLLIDAE